MKLMIGHEIKLFIVVRLLTILLDFLAYRGLLWFDVFDRFSPTVNIDISKMSGFFIGTLFAYFANKYWTFGHQNQASGTFWRFLIIYLLTIGTNVLVNSLALKSVTFIAFIGAQEIGRVFFAFILATLISTVVSFVGMKFYVFKAIKKKALESEIEI
jgi:putative flippase GtrA